MTTSKQQVPETLQPYADALQHSIRLYEQSHLDQHRDTLLKAFIDIIHDDHTLDRFFTICATVPLLLNGSRADFYLYENKTRRFLCVCDSEHGLLDPPCPDTSGLHEDFRTVQEYNGRLLFPLYPRTGTTQQEVSGHEGQGLYDPDPYFASHSLLGMYCVSPVKNLTSADRNFFLILTRWIGNKLNNRLIASRHLEHLHFLSDLGRDIGHNIIVPNMYLKYLLRRVEKQIEGLRDIEQKAEKFADLGFSSRQYIDFLSGCREKRQALEQTYKDLLKHHNQITLFLESLFREQHFEQGHLVLRPTRCFVERDIILPQLDLYLDKLNTRGITVDKPVNLYKQEFPLMVDIGLLSQVYANLFSNAVKYTEEIINHEGSPRKALAYGAEELDDFPAPGHKGIKFNVFTTGTPLTREEQETVFNEGQRAENSKGIEGSGHGLNFIQRVIQVHGGKVGCEATDEGNNFYFILPVSPLKDAQG